MLPKNQRLGKDDFSFVFRNGASRRTANFLIKKAKIPCNKARFAVVVPKAVVKTAVGRNKIKRKVFSAIKKGYSTQNINSVVFVVKNDIRKLDQVAVLSEIGVFLKT